MVYPGSGVGADCPQASVAKVTSNRNNNIHLFIIFSTSSKV
jgi:hypothetical protein